jgi:5'-nucleotidase
VPCEVGTTAHVAQRQMKTIAVDMDGVLADVLALFLELDARDFGRRKTLEEIWGVPELEAFDRCLEYLHRDGFFRGAPVIADSQDVLFRLNQHYNVYIVSAATEYPKSLSEKQAWLNEHFPFITWQRMVFCGSKQIVRADIMIDDHLKNLDFFPGKTLLFTQPHNATLDAPRHQRVKSWKEIAALLL